MKKDIITTVDVQNYADKKGITYSEAKKILFTPKPTKFVAKDGNSK